MQLQELESQVIEFLKEIQTDVKNNIEFNEWFDWPSKSINEIRPNHLALNVSNDQGKVVGILYAKTTNSIVDLDVFHKTSI